MKKILITGGAGFIGSHLAEYLLKNDNEVIALDNFSTGRLENLDHLRQKPNLSIIDADIRDPDFVKFLKDVKDTATLFQ